MTADRTPRWTQANDAAPARRTAYRACGIAAECSGTERRRDRDAGAAAGLPRLPRFVPWVVRHAERVLHVAAERVLTQVELAEEHRAVLAEPTDGGSILVRDVVHDVAAKRRAHPFRVELVFDRDGEAVERAPHCAAGEFRFCRARFPHRALFVERDVGVQPLKALRPCDERLGQFDGRDLAAGKQS